MNSSVRKSEETVFAAGICLAIKTTFSAVTQPLSLNILHTVTVSDEGHESFDKMGEKSCCYERREGNEVNKEVSTVLSMEKVNFQRNIGTITSKMMGNDLRMF